MKRSMFAIVVTLVGASVFVGTLFFLKPDPDLQSMADQDQPNINVANTKTTTRASGAIEAKAQRSIAASNSADSQSARASSDQVLEIMDALRAAVADPANSQNKFQEIQSKLQQLLQQAKDDPSVLNALLAQFRLDRDPALEHPLALLLAQIEDPQVEKMAQELALSSNPADQKAGLEILGALNMPSKKTFEIASQMLSHPDADPDVLMYAIGALPDQTLADLPLDQTKSQLSLLATQHPSDGVRSSSLFRISKWATTSQDFAPLLQALDENRPMNDRVSAAMAISESQVINDDLRDALLSRLSDEDEVWEIRRRAAEALERFQLTGQDHQQYQAFIEEQDNLRKQQ